MHRGPTRRSSHCNLAEINVAALKKFNEALEARAATEAPTMMASDTIEPTAAPESDAADRVALERWRSRCSR